MIESVMKVPPRAVNAGGVATGNEVQMRPDDSTRTHFRWADWREPSARFWKKVDKSGGPGACWLWLASCQYGGHGQFQANRMGEPKRVVQAHRWAFEELNGPIPEGMVVRHACDNPPCVNPAHLLLGSQVDNVADMVGRGRGFVPQAVPMPGESNPNAKLTAEQVQVIRDRWEAGETGRGLAREYGVSPAQISRIVNGKRWA